MSNRDKKYREGATYKAKAKTSAFKRGAADRQREWRRRKGKAPAVEQASA